MTSELLQQVRVIDPVSGIDCITDVLIKDGLIGFVADNISDLPNDTHIKNCQGLVLGPGLVDLYSHSGEPGFEERESLLSLMQAASAGGFTRINVLPDTSPAVDDPSVVAQLLQKSRMLEGQGGQERQGGQGGQGGQGEIPTSVSLPLVNVWGAMTEKVAGKQMTELADLAAAGVVGFTDGQPWENFALVRRVLEYLQPLGKPVAFYCCNPELKGNGVVREGLDALRLGLPFIPVSAETSAIAALLELASPIGIPIHIMRVSTARSVELIAAAKASGVPVTASTTWMHLLLDTKAVKSYDPSLRLEPPLGNSKDLSALRQAVKTGVVDAIAIDHSPYTYEEKTVAFAEAPPGAIGFELAFPFLWQSLVESGEWTAVELWRALSTRPAECLQQKPSAIAPGEQAEMILFDPQESWKVEKKNLYTLSTNTPWLGQQIQGRVVRTATGKQ
ncbi:dihydroorotase [Scytonema sp. UIC 10036]|uniref:dihydroorotase n=1 Tax=Scytonema sp. UIC 10036 TaxID=2304196 RepID=UPI0012DA9B82|nr:dihydroorotase [Scytonema sp. UIC 10036]MUG93990.1 dihydroorotase [Scytonema sp. UIC 10036]